MFGFFSKKKPPAKKKAEAEKPAAKSAAKAVPATAKPAAAKPAAPKPAAKAEPVSAGDSLERAKAKLAKKATPGSREALIEQALAVHQQQAKKLDNLPEETLTRLRAMALKAFVLPGGAKDKSKLN